MFSFLKHNKVQSNLTIKTQASRLKDKHRKRYTIVTVQHNGKEVAFFTKELTHQRAKSFPLEVLHYVLNHVTHIDLKSVLKRDSQNIVQINKSYFKVSDLSF